MLKQIETLGQAYNNIYAQWESIGLFTTGVLLGLWAVRSYRKRGTFILKIPRLIIGSKIEKNTCTTSIHRACVLNKILLRLVLPALLTYSRNQFLLP